MKGPDLALLLFYEALSYENDQFPINYRFPIYLY